MWLLELQALKALNNAQAQVANICAMPGYEAFRDRGFSSDSPRILNVLADQAHINVSGVLTKEPDFFASVFGGGNTSYSEILAAITIAESDDSIKGITFDIDSPGGQVKGLFDVIDAIQGISKPTTAKVSGMAASAAFAIATQADEIIASNRSDMFGSVGIIANVFVDDEVVSITSSEAPNKAPDVTTDAGKAVVQKELDGLHNLFVDAIANGRTKATNEKFSVDRINSDFGRGGVVLALEAEERGMIDKVAKVDLTIVDTSNLTAASSGKETGIKSMDLAELKAKHPDVYEAAVKVGQVSERDRVTAHLTLGKSSKSLDVAIEAIEQGAALDQTYTAKYLAAGMNRSDIDAMADDNVDTVDDGTAANESDANTEALFAMVNSGMSVEA
jgi:ClpP class serine protease